MVNSALGIETEAANGDAGVTVRFSDCGRMIVSIAAHQGPSKLLDDPQITSKKVNEQSMVILMADCVKHLWKIGSCKELWLEVRD